MPRSGLSCLDFLETIAYFANRDYISTDDAKELLGQSITYNFLIFKDWILARRDDAKDNSYYSELVKLVYRMSNNGNKFQKEAEYFIKKNKMQ